MLRARNEVEAAADLEHGELRRALTAARVSAPDAVDEAALLAEESSRVANAAVLAELLAPMLAARLAGVAAVPTSSPPTRRDAAPARAAAAAGPPGIADLIDGMLAQQQSSPPRP